MRVLALATTLLGFGCSSTPMTTMTSGPPTKWLGAQEHLRVVGTINKEKVDIDINGADAQNTTKLWCEREYSFVVKPDATYDYTQGGNSEVRLRAVVTINGQERILSIDVKRYNLQKAAPNSNIPIVTRVDAQAPGSPTWAFPNQMWFHYKYYDMPNADAGMGNPDLGVPYPVGASTYNQAALMGTYTLGEFTGSVDSTGAMIKADTGDVGGFATAQWSATESLAISYTAKCTIDNIDDH